MALFIKAQQLRLSEVMSEPSLSADGALACFQVLDVADVADVPDVPDVLNDKIP